MQIYGPTHVHGAQPIAAPHINRTSQPTETPRSASTGDELQISPQADIAARLSEIPDIRQDRVAAIRTAIADGTYETSDKLDVALNRLLDEIG